MNALAIELLNGVSLMAILGIAALGMGIVFGLMGIINLAHGEFLMLGAYVAVVAHQTGLNHWLAMVVACAVIFVVGAAIEMGLIRHVNRKPELTILATFGLSIVLRQLAELVFQKDLRSVPNPNPGATEVLGVLYPTYRYYVIVVALTVVVVTLLVFTRSQFGLRIRAVVANADLAETVGISTGRVNFLAFSLGAATAGIAGALVAPLGSVSPDMGRLYLPGAFLVVIAGGVGRMWSVLIGAVVIAAVHTGVTHYVDAVWGQITVLALAVVILQMRRHQKAMPGVT